MMPSTQDYGTKNKGEWSEPYAAVKILGEQKLYIADKKGEKNLFEWMDVIELIRHETEKRKVIYKYNSSNTDVCVYVNDSLFVSVPVDDFLRAAETLSDEIKRGKGTFQVSKEIADFFTKIELHSIKAKSVEKNDVFLTIRDPRASITRKHIGFSIKSEFGKDSTLFNTAPASAAIYHISNMNDKIMDEINSLFDTKNRIAVSSRCNEMINRGCDFKYKGFEYSKRTSQRTFQDNLETINPRLSIVISRMLYNYYCGCKGKASVSYITDEIIKQDPCNVSRPEIDYPYMIKTFLYAAYSGMTASTPWNAKNEVNGGFIKVKSSGEVIAFYALESDVFKDYLYNNCYMDQPSTSSGHGDFGYVYKKDNDYFFKLNFQIRCP